MRRGENRRLRACATLVALAAFALSVGCAPTFSKEQVRTHQEMLRGGVRAMPGWHWLYADVTRDGDAALVHVTAEQACARRLVHEAVTEREAKERPSTGGLWMDPVTPVAWLVFPFIFYPPVLLAGLAGGGVAALADLSKYSTHSSRSVSRRAAGMAPAHCPRGSKVHPQRVELSLLDGTRLDARLDAGGHARIAIPPALWASHGGRLDFDVRVDGILVARAVLEHAP